MDTATFQFGSWQVNRRDNSISDATDRHQIEPRAMDVLVALCAEPNTVFSSEQLLLQCWGSTLYGDNPVHKTITQLRKVLGDNRTNPSYIETIRKRGYRTIATVQHNHAEGPLTGSWDASPFRGLQAFDEQHAPIFFGRNDAICRLTQLIVGKVEQRTALEMVMILGPSGSGKTSLVRAGLLPRLMQTGQAVQIASASSFDMAEKGEHSLFTALAGILLDLAVADEGIFPRHSAMSLGLALQENMDGIAATLRDSLARGGARSGRRHFLFIDRFEAVFDENGIHAAERQHFLLTLGQLARSGAVIVLLACRNDFYPQVAACSSLMEGKAEGGHFDLGAPSHAEVAQMIRLPALAAGLTFGVERQSNTRLDDVLSECAIGNPDALPLLQYTLHELYRLRSNDGELSFADFHDMGGIEGAIGRRAEQVFNDWGELQKKCLPHVLSQVTTISTHGSIVTSRRCAWSQLADENERAVVVALVESRLFVSDLVGDVPGFGVAHEALLRRWPRVVDWIDRHRNALQVRTRISELALRWHEQANSDDLLLPEGMQLDEALGLLGMSAFSLSHQERALIAASSQRVRTRKRVRVAALGAIAMLALLVGGLGLSTYLAQREASERPVAVERLMNNMLSSTGQPDLSDTAKAEALNYFANTGEQKLNASSLAQRPATLLALAEMFNRRADPKAMLEAATTAQLLLREQLVQRPQDAKLLESGWNIASRFGRLLMKPASQEAARSFRLAQDYANHLHDRDPGNVAWWILQSKSHLDLGDLAMQVADLPAAESAFGKAIGLSNRALAVRPNDETLSARLVDTMYRLGTVNKAQGALQAAMQLHTKEAELERKHFLANPKDDVWGYRLAKALHEQAELNLALGNDLAAINKLEQAQQLYLRIQRHDPSNHQWLSATINSRILVQDIRARSGSTREILANLQRIATTLQELWDINPSGQALPLRALANLDALLRASIVMRLIELPRPAGGAQPLLDAVQRLSTAEARLAQQIKLNPFDNQARMILADALIAHASYLRQRQDNPAAQQICRQGRELLLGRAEQSFEYELIVRWLELHICLGMPDIVSATQQRLAHIGYRDTRYLRIIGEKK